MSLILSQLDYGSATLAGLLSQLLDRSQSVQNAAARLIFSTSRHVHFTPLLRSLHWLWVPERIMFRLAVLVYRCIHGLAPIYQSADLMCNVLQRICSVMIFQHWLVLALNMSPSVTAFTTAAPAIWNSLPEEVRWCQCSSMIWSLNSFGPRHSKWLTSLFCNVALNFL